MHRTYFPFFVIMALFLLYSCKQEEKKPDESRAHFYKGNDYLFNDEMQNAIKEYEMALKADSNNWQACYQMAQAYQLQGDINNAFLYLNKTLLIKPDFALGYYGRSGLSELINDERGSTKDLQKAVTLKRDLFPGLLALARKEYGKGNYKTAIAIFDTAIKVQPDFFMTYSMRGSCAFAMKDYDAAISDFDMEIKLAPTHAMGYVNRSLAYGEMKNYRAAITDVDAALQIDPLWPQAYIYRGMYYIQLKNKDSACGDFRMAYKLKHPQAEAYSKQYCQ